MSMDLATDLFDQMDPENSNLVNYEDFERVYIQAENHNQKLVEGYQRRLEKLIDDKNFLTERINVTKKSEVITETGIMKGANLTFTLLSIESLGRGLFTRTSSYYVKFLFEDTVNKTKTIRDGESVINMRFQV